MDSIINRLQAKWFISNIHLHCLCWIFALIGRKKLAHNHKREREMERTVWAVVRKRFDSKTRLLLLNLLVFPSHFYYLLNEYVTILRCSLIFIASKFTPFIFTAKNNGMDFIFPIAHRATTENRFLLFFSSETIIHSQFDEYSNQMSCKQQIMRELIMLYGSRDIWHASCYALFCYFHAWLHLITLDPEYFFIIILSSKNELHIFFYYYYYVSILKWIIRNFNVLLTFHWKTG